MVPMWLEVIFIAGNSLPPPPIKVKPPDQDTPTGPKGGRIRGSPLYSTNPPP